MAKTSEINLSKVEKMAGIAFKNGLRLHFDSILLFNNKSFPSAYFLSILALEEIGKSFLLEDFWWHSKIDGRMGKKREREFLDLIYFHRVKQSSFARSLEPRSLKNFIELLYSGNIELQKQNATYVGLKKINKEIDLKSRINDPLKLTGAEASEQITRVNDGLLEFTVGVIKGVYGVETESVSKILNRKLFNRLKKSWPMTDNKVKIRIHKLENIQRHPTSKKDNLSPLVKTLKSKIKNIYRNVTCGI